VPADVLVQAAVSARIAISNNPTSRGLTVQPPRLLRPSLSPFKTPMWDAPLPPVQDQGVDTAVVTGASSGIGEATARQLAEAGFFVVVGARRVDRLETIAKEINGTALELDVTDPESVAAFCSRIPACHVLVNNAGGARGLDPVLEADESHWRWMWETNVLGTLRMTKALLPKLVDSGNGHVVTVTSVAATELYDNGAGYTSAKHAQSALHRTLRGELLGQPVRFTEILPGMVRTDFSTNRFGGDAERADKVYEGLTPLSADDVADVITFAVTRPPHVNLDQIVLKPRAQYSASRAFRT
jgi:NADP-dependent 3-hydroxy acid dehydrogenase YdfG